VVGLDLARALALVGMMATHILPSADADGISFTQQVAGGRASALFAVLAGVSLALMSGGTTPVRGRERSAVTAGLVTRALVIAGIGLLLGEVDSGIAVILTYYGVLFLLGLPFLGLSARALVVWCAGWTVVVPVLSHLLRPHLPSATYANPTLERLLDPVPLVTELTVTGYYPAVPWLAYLLAGMALGRSDLRRWGTTARVAALGAGLVVVAWTVSDALLDRPGVRRALRTTFEGAGFRGDLDSTLTHGLYGTTPTGSPWWLAVRTPHTATPFDLAQTIGSALLVIAVCLVVARMLPELTAVVAGAGAMTLTLYTAHVLSRAPGWWDGDDVATFTGQVLLALAIGAGFRLTRNRGPLEVLAGEAGKVTAQAVRGR
jgi:hypothetical protein